MSNKRKIQELKNVKLSPYFESSNHESCSLNSERLSEVTNTCSGKKMTEDFYNIPCVELAKALLGKTLVRKSCDIYMRGKIVETESYLGGDDKASISYGGKITEKSKPMYMKPGTAFVYITYGMYNLLNISSLGEGAAVLIRALEPTEGSEIMSINRNSFQPYKNKPKKTVKEFLPHLLCNGPAKLCISLNITKKQCNMQDLSTWNEMWLEDGEDVLVDKIVSSRRIGIESAGEEWANKLLRFYILHNKCVSRRDKYQETLLLKTS